MQAAQRKTPGVYVTELSAFPPSVVGVETAVPAFIGYTKKAELNGRPVTLNPVKITSLAEYEETFGAGYRTQFNLTQVSPPPAPPTTDPLPPADITIGDKSYALVPDATSPTFHLYNSLRLFYANGGGTCYIVSVGQYSAAGATSEAFEKGLKIIEDHVGPTMLVMPDALLLSSGDYYKIIQLMLKQCGRLGDRVAILDLHGSDKLKEGNREGMEKLVTDFRSGVGTEQLSYGMAYFPWLKTSVVPASDINFLNLTPAAIDTLKAQLKVEAQVYKGDDQTDPRKSVLEKIDQLTGDTLKEPLNKTLNQDLMAALPALKALYAAVAKKLDVLPAAGAMAGIYTYVDSTRGVWNAPANISLTGVTGPAYKVTSNDQEDLNVPIQGKAVNAIRYFVGRGTLVWGARTLDGNSNDYRYIQVRRTLIYIEQSIKQALNQFVFAPNDGQTWVTVTSMISNFLQGLWTQGGLMGAKASEAFSVQCGLGSTMTGMDILNGYMRVQVTLQMIRPAEFIELTFTQKMQGVG